MVTHHGRTMAYHVLADHVQTWSALKNHGTMVNVFAGVSWPAVGVKSQAAQAQYESTCGWVIFKMTVIVKDLMGIQVMDSRR